MLNSLIYNLRIRLELNGLCYGKDNENRYIEYSRNTDKKERSSDQNYKV